MTVRERILGGRIFDRFRPVPAETPAEVAPVEAPVSTENLSQEEIRAEALLVEVARREPAAFGVLYERYVDRIYGYIYHRVGNVQEAEGRSPTPEPHLEGSRWGSTRGPAS